MVMSNFKEKQKQAKELGINIFGMNAEKLDAAIQAKLSEQQTEQTQNEEKRKPGRPVVEGSERQKRLAEMNKRKEENGGVVKRGRTPNPESKHYQKKMERLSKIEAGVVLKPGRPKMIKVEVPENITTETTVENEVSVG